MSTEAEVVEAGKNPKALPRLKLVLRLTLTLPAVNKVSFRDVQAANGTGPAVDTLSLLGYEKIPKDGKVHSINYDSVSGLDITGAKTGFYQAGSSADFVHKVVRFTGMCSHDIKLLV